MKDTSQALSALMALTASFSVTGSSIRGLTAQVDANLAFGNTTSANATATDDIEGILGFLAEVANLTQEEKELYFPWMKLNNPSLEENPKLSCYDSVDEIYEEMDRLAKQHPMYVSVSTIGESWLKEQRQGGHLIQAMILSAPSDAKKSDMFIAAGHHSRELPPPEAVMIWARNLLDNYGNDADVTWILDRTRIHIVPVVNPDGREMVQNHLDWNHRKSLHSYGCVDEESGSFTWFGYNVSVADLPMIAEQMGGGPFNGVLDGSLDGVDLNRQYPFFWGLDSGSSSDPCHDTFRGPSPLSEPESRAVFEYGSRIFADEYKKGSVEEAEEKWQEACPEETSGIYLDVHSHGGMVLFPYVHELNTTAPNHKSLLAMASKMVPDHYKLWGPEQTDFLYPGSGGSHSSMYGINCVSSFSLEIGTEFNADCFEIETQIVPELHDVLITAAKAVKAPYKIALGPDVLTIAVDTTDADFAKLTVAVSDVAKFSPKMVYDDGELGQPIAEVRLWLDEHPDEEEKSDGSLMSAQDGAFDEVDEVATFSLDTSRWNNGERHTLYFRAVNSEGYAGPVSAVYAEKGEETTSAASRLMTASIMSVAVVASLVPAIFL